MIPATLALIPNYPGVLGTFDHETWWKSEPIEDLDEIIAVCWVYGEYHACAAKMLDGTYSIWQSYNNGYSWREQLNIPDRIYAMVRPNYGQVIISTAAGWYRSNNSGTDWALISVQAAGCHTVKELTGDVLVALDGTYIYRSADGGVNWARAVIKGTATPITATTLYPTVAGTAADCIVGCSDSNCSMTFSYLGFSGPFSVPSTAGDITLTTSQVNPSYKDILLYSSDGAVSFVACEPDSGWALREATYTIGTPVVSGTADNYWETGAYRKYIPTTLFPRATYNDVITDIEMTGINEEGLPQFVIQVLMPSGLCRHYWIRRIVEVGSSNKQFWVIARFDSRATPGKSLESSQVNISGTEDYLLLATFAGMNTNGQPMLKTSDDGGETWDIYDPSTAIVYQEPDLTNEANNPFLDDAYIKFAWSYPLCHNGWRPISDHYEKFQSYEMGVAFSPWTQHAEDYDMTGLVEGDTPRTYRMTGRTNANHTADYSFAGLLGEDKTATYDVAALIQVIARATYRMHWHREDYPIASYAMSGFILASHFPTIIFPQAFNLEFPWFAEQNFPYSSSTED